MAKAKYPHPYQGNIRIHEKNILGYRVSVRLLGDTGRWHGLGRYKTKKQCEKVAIKAIDDFIIKNSIDLKRYVDRVEFTKKNRHLGRKKTAKKVAERFVTIPVPVVDFDEETTSPKHTHCYICGGELPEEEIKMQSATHLACWEKMILDEREAD